MIRCAFLFYVLPTRIGIRSEDLRDSLEKSVKGSGIALSSPRLVVPAAIYGFWVLLHKNFASDLFDLQVIHRLVNVIYQQGFNLEVFKS